MTALVLGTPAGEKLWGLAGTDTKIDAKQGDDQLIGSNGNDLLIAGQGNDVIFGGLGADTFEFGKNANPGDKDYVMDFNLDLGDQLKFGPNVTILTAVASKDEAPNEFNGINLVNDARVYDLKLTLQIDDGDKHFTQEVTLLDVIKNKTFSADQFNTYLDSLGFHGDITFA